MRISFTLTFTADGTQVAVWERATGKHIVSFQLAPVLADRFNCVIYEGRMHLILEDSEDWKCPRWSAARDWYRSAGDAGGCGQWHLQFDPMNGNVLSCVLLSEDHDYCGTMRLCDTPDGLHLVTGREFGGRSSVPISTYRGHTIREGATARAMAAG